MPQALRCARVKSAAISGLVGYGLVVFVYCDIQFRGPEGVLFPLWAASVWFWPYFIVAACIDNINSVAPRVISNTMTASIGLSILLTHYSALMFPIAYGIYRRKGWLLAAGGALIILNVLAWPLWISQTIKF